MRALVLDDDEVDQLRIQQIAHKAGLDLDFTEVFTIGEMRAQLEVPFDLVFIDYNLGMETGLDALKVLLAHEEQTEAIPIMLTSVTRRAIAVEAMRRGCADYLVKEELSIDSLRKAIVSAFERRMFYSAISDARAFQDRMKVTVARFMGTCGPEMRDIMSNTLNTLRQMKMEGDTTTPADENFTLLERGCNDLVIFLDDLMGIVDVSRSQKPESVKLFSAKKV
ncbi:MAG: response regulator [Vannielia sp.]|nr:response regulator [Vannielia sp.]